MQGTKKAELATWPFPTCRHYIEPQGNTQDSLDTTVLTAAKTECAYLEACWYRLKNKWHPAKPSSRTFHPWKPLKTAKIRGSLTGTTRMLGSSKESTRAHPSEFWDCTGRFSVLHGNTTACSHDSPIWEKCKACTAICKSWPTLLRSGISFAEQQYFLDWCAMQDLHWTTLWTKQQPHYVYAMLWRHILL